MLLPPPPPTPPWWKIQWDAVSSGNPLINPIDERLMHRVSPAAALVERWCSLFLRAGAQFILPHHNGDVIGVSSWPRPLCSPAL